MEYLVTMLPKGLLVALILNEFHEVDGAMRFGDARVGARTGEYTTCKYGRLSRQKGTIRLNMDKGTGVNREGESATKKDILTPMPNKGSCRSQQI